MKKSTILLIICLYLVLGGAAYGIMFLHDNRDCTTTIEFTDGTKITCKGGPSSYDNGMTSYETCAGTLIKVPTVRIKIIK